MNEKPQPFKLDTMMVIGGLADTRNWQSLGMARNQLYFVSWIDLDEVEAPEDDLRLRAAALGATGGGGSGHRSAGFGNGFCCIRIGNQKAHHCLPVRLSAYQQAPHLPSCPLALHGAAPQACMP